MTMRSIAIYVRVVLGDPLTFVTCDERRKRLPPIITLWDAMRTVLAEVVVGAPEVAVGVAETMEAEINRHSWPLSPPQVHDGGSPM